MRIIREPALVVLSAVAFSGVAAAQPQRVATVFPLVRFLISLLVTLVVGGITLAAALRFVERVVGTTRDEPVAAGLTGVAVLVIEILVLYIAWLFGPLMFLVAIPFLLLGLLGQVIGVITLGCLAVEEFAEASHWRACSSAPCWCR